MKCQYHPRANAVGICSVCGIALCKRCIINDRGTAYCDGCYASHDDEDSAQLVHAEEMAESEDYVDLELMDLLDTDDDDGLL